MPKKEKRQASKGVSRNRTMVAIGAMAAMAAAIGIAGYNSSIPANGSAPVFGLAANHFLKTTHSGKEGYIYVSQSSGSVKGLKSGGGVVNPSYAFTRGNLQSLHLINEDSDTHSKHNLNIDAFNVHTKDLGYFESQTVTFVPDRAGTFEYYCNIHPEMKGDITVE